MLNIRQLPVELQKKAIEELNEIPDRLENDVKVIREWLEENPHIVARTDDQFLVNFLRGAKFNIERCQKKLETFYKVRTKSPELMMNRDPNCDRIRKIIKLGFGVVLPTLHDPSSPITIIVRAGIYNPQEYSLEEVMKVVIIILDILLKENDNFVVSGQICIIDLKNVKFAHLMQYSTGFLKKFFTMTQNASPGRLKGFHFVNVPYNFERVFGMFTFFMTDKMRQRASIHGSDFSALYNLIPKNYLPEEYGGEVGPIDDICEQWEKKILENRDYIIEEESFGIDTSLKPDDESRSFFGWF